MMAQQIKVIILTLLLKDSIFAINYLSFKPFRVISLTLQTQTLVAVIKCQSFFYCNDKLFKQSPL